MTTNDYAPFLINDRSSALLHLMDACQFTESELSDVYDGVFNRMKESFAPDTDTPPNVPYDVRAVREYVATLKAASLSEQKQDFRYDHQPTAQEAKEALDGLINEFNTDETLLFEVEPLEAYMILGMMQAAIVSLGVPENLEKFGRSFIGAFCDRYRILFPDVVKTLEMGWTTCLTSEEFDDLIDSDEDLVRVISLGDDEMLGIPISDDFPNDYVDDFA